ncbi:MAG: hypothetical protein JWP22_1214 [Ramlibacter sp.]|jgi:hypothetical protein|nr:hypothetical protein [Ramlibacter sp.]MDB5912539.1 hypothetical protein [Ramlibacter sp.]
MDYRNTEDFARRAEAASLRAPHLRGEAVVDFWQWVARGWRAILHPARRPLATRNINEA